MTYSTISAALHAILYTDTDEIIVAAPNGQELFIWPDWTGVCDVGTINGTHYTRYASIDNAEDIADWLDAFGVAQ